MLLRPMQRRSTSLHALLLAFVLGACGGADIGESCDTPGSTDECVSDAICTNESAGGVCRQICDNHGDCPDAHSCNGVSGSSIKSCQPD